MKNVFKTAILVTFVALSSTSVFAKIIENPIVFKKGSYGTNLKGTFKGDDEARYTLHAKAGQQLKFKIKSTKNLAYLNIYAPEDKPGSAEAILKGAIVGSTGEITLPETGQYTLQLYQMRNTARRGEIVNYNIELKIIN
ncbi:DNA breaking-rejoining protein [Acinetobacter celticus]|uniref:DNA breaking-rejoining protein n=1 Tax=Acinetobacter celticus TaxID=1891224 RepID=A0A1C3CUX2_9GAMM|nr:DNA breaking-rejoining protein [Acinetobacter celticus]ODA12554.1 DNA breaking-rejoining protein [Acinetobacter celticus]